MKRVIGQFLLLTCAGPRMRPAVWATMTLAELTKPTTDAADSKTFSCRALMGQAPIQLWFCQQAGQVEVLHLRLRTMALEQVPRVSSLS